MKANFHTTMCPTSSVLGQALPFFTVRRTCRHGVPSSNGSTRMTNVLWSNVLRTFATTWHPCKKSERQEASVLVASVALRGEVRSSCGRDNNQKIGGKTSLRQATRCPPIRALQMKSVRNGPPDAP